MANSTRTEKQNTTKGVLDNMQVDSLNDSQTNSDSQGNNNTSDSSKARIYNIQNLSMYGKDKPVLSHEEAKKNGRKGGKKSGEVRRQRKTMREGILDMLSQELTPEKLEEMGVDTSTLNGDYTMQNAVISAMLREAINGSEKAMQLLRDTIGEQPTIRQEITETITHEDAQMMENLTKALTG